MTRTPVRCKPSVCWTDAHKTVAEELTAPNSKAVTKGTRIEKPRLRNPAGCLKTTGPSFGSHPLSVPTIVNGRLDAPP